MTGESIGSVLSPKIKQSRTLTLLAEGDGNIDDHVNIERVIVGFFGVIDLAHVQMFLMRNSGDPDGSHGNKQGSVNLE